MRISSVNLSHASIKRYEDCKKRLVEELGHYYLSDLRKKDIQAFIKKIGIGDKKGDNGVSVKSQKRSKCRNNFKLHINSFRKQNNRGIMRKDLAQACVMIKFVQTK